ncbi:MAG TPA: porin family protein, partial [Ferruginibacter sp.]|nr:porin family protein [Ferruginibacter sp.]
MKRKLLFFAMAMMAVASSFAQTPDRYTVSGGVLGAANYSKFRLDNETPGSETKFKWGYAPGVFVTFPLGNVVALEAQAQYSRIGSKYKTSSSVLDSSQELTYLSVPLFFKLHAGRFLSFNFGGQADFLLKAKKTTNQVDQDNENNFDHTSLGVLGGIEFFPRERVTLFAKYVHSLKK